MIKTVEQLRRERYGVVQLLNHYLYLVEAVVNYAVEANHVHAEDVGEGAIMFTLRK